MVSWAKAPAEWAITRKWRSLWSCEEVDIAVPGRPIRTAMASMVQMSRRTVLHDAHTSSITEMESTAPLSPHSEKLASFESAQPNSTDTGLLALPSDMVFHVLQYLDMKARARLSQVCKVLWAHVNDPYLWRSVNFGDVTPAQLSQLVQCCPNFRGYREAHIQLSWNLYDRTLEKDAMKLPEPLSHPHAWQNIEVLHLELPILSSRSRVYSAVLTAINWAAWPSLKELEISTTRLMISWGMMDGRKTNPWELLLTECSSKLPSLQTLRIVAENCLKDSSNPPQSLERGSGHFGALTLSYDCTTQKMETAHTCRDRTEAELQELYEQCTYVTGVHSAIWREAK